MKCIALYLTTEKHEKQKIKILLMVLVGFIIYSCQDEEAFLQEKEENQIIDFEKKRGEGMMKLGKQLEKPYSVENMKKAMASLKSSGSGARISGGDLDIKTSHLYIKFTPFNEEEYDLLKKDSLLILFDYPLDYEIEVGGDYYHDPEVPIDQPTYQYAAVKVDYELPEVPYLILSELYIPEELELDKEGSSNKEDIVNALVEEALSLTNNLEPSGSDEQLNARNRDWRPAGRIRVWDGSVGSNGEFVPVVGVEVRANRWFTTYTGRTNSQGRFTCNGTFKRDANYSIRWERFHFSVRSGAFGQASYDGPKQTGDWDLTIGSSGSGTIVNNSQQYYALIFQAAHDYYHGNRFGLSRPPLISPAHPQVKIAAYLNNDRPSRAAMWARPFGVFPTIGIRRWQSEADRVYAVTAHELAHAAHWDMDRDAFRTLAAHAYINPFIQSAESVIESWAVGVEWQFAVHRYRNLFGDVDYRYRNNFQRREIAEHRIYTSLAIDMIDDVNQRLIWGPLVPQDRAEGYTIRQIEQGLRGATSWNQWRNNMVSRHNNPSQNFIPELFGNWY